MQRQRGGPKKVAPAPKKKVTPKKKSAPKGKAPGIADRAALVDPPPHPGPSQKKTPHPSQKPAATPSSTEAPPNAAAQKGAKSAPGKEPTKTPVSTSGTIAVGGPKGLQSQLAKAGIQGKQMGQIVKAISAWGQAQGLQIKENTLVEYINSELIVESTYERWSALAGVRVIRG